MASKGTKGRAQADPILHREVVAICRLKKRATTHGKAFLADIVQIGKRLSGVKDRVGHGNWLPWLHHNFDWSGETAANYMAIFRLSKTSKFQSLKNLPLEVLYLLGRKTVSEETRNTIVAHFEGGEKVTIPVVKKLMKIPAPMYSVPKVVSPKLAVKVASPKYVAPIDYESTQSADIILEQVRRLATSVADKFAVAGDVAHIADRVP